MTTIYKGYKVCSVIMQSENTGHSCICFSKVIAPDEVDEKVVIEEANGHFDEAVDFMGLEESEDDVTENKSILGLVVDRES